MAREVTLGRSLAMVVMRRIDEMRRLPAPAVTWTWSEVDVGGGTLQKLRDTDPALIESVEGGWKTSERLADFLRARYDVELVENPVAADDAQATLTGERKTVTPVESSESPVARTDGGDEQSEDGRQVSIGDGPVEMRAKERRDAKKQTRKQQRSVKHKKAKRDGEQATLFDVQAE